jgi:signal transduction histidine kinase
LGFSICNSIVTRLCGDIGFESPPGMGATFHVCLPIYAYAPTSSKADLDDP